MKKFLIAIGLSVVGYFSLNFVFNAPNIVLPLGVSLFQSSAALKGHINVSHRALDTIGDYKYMLFVPDGECDIKLADSLEEVTIKIVTDDIIPESVCKDEHMLLLQKSFIKIVTDRDPILYFIESKERDLNQSIKYHLKEEHI